MMDELKLLAVFEPVEGTQPVGEVLSQSVAVGESVPEGTTVTFTYSDGEKLIEKVISFTVPESSGEVFVEMFLDTTQVFASDLPGTQGLLEVPVYQKAGSYELRIYVDDVLEHYEVMTFGE